MRASSRPVESSQQGLHPRLKDQLARHSRAPWRAPPRMATIGFVDQLCACMAADPAPLVLDLGCGTGASTLALADDAAWVVGIDQSAARLGPRAAWREGRVVLQREDATMVLKLLAQRAVIAQKVWLLYPNPWPKPEHLQRRWHGHPAFFALLAVAESIELRCNWWRYANEFALALQWAGWTTMSAPLVVESPLSPHERKYAASGHALWRVVGQRSKTLRER
jgi:tRNA (guanine-N7-)-methyltransferase